MLFDSVNAVLNTGESKELSLEQLDMLRARMHRSERAIHHLCMEAGFPPDFVLRRMRERPLKDKP